MSAVKAIAMRQEEEFPVDLLSLNLDDYGFTSDGCPHLCLEVNVSQDRDLFQWLPDQPPCRNDLSPPYNDMLTEYDFSHDKTHTFQPEDTIFDLQQLVTSPAVSSGPATPCHSSPATPCHSGTSTPGAVKSEVSSPAQITPSVSPFTSHPSSPKLLSRSPSHSSSKDAKARVPRHKRKSHIDAEQRRRSKIQNAFEELKETIPSVRDTVGGGSKESKSSLLNKTVEYCRELRGANKGLQREANKLRQEMQALTADITMYQTQLPVGGVPSVPTKTATPARVEAMFEDYLRAKSLANWKFWIFGLIVRPLFNSFNRTVVTQSTEEFCSSVMTWVQDHMSLVALRPALLSTLRFLSKNTSVMTTPEKLPSEATRAAIDSTLNDTPAPSCPDYPMSTS